MKVEKSISSEIEWPEVKAYAATSSVVARFPGTGHQWYAPCQFCGQLHAHGAGEGPRHAHCGVYGVEQPTAYQLVYAGVAPREVLAMLLKKLRSRASLDNMAKHDPRKWTRELIEAANDALSAKEPRTNAA